MLALTLIVHIFIGSTVAGSLIIAALTMGYDTAQPLIATAIVGFLISIPASWYIARSVSRVA